MIALATEHAQTYLIYNLQPFISVFTLSIYIIPLCDSRVETESV